MYINGAHLARISGAVRALCCNDSHETAVRHTMHLSQVTIMILIGILN